MNLVPRDVAMFKHIGVDVETLERAHVRRVTDREARQDFGVGFSPASDLAGILFPYILPWTGQVHTYRLRRDNPELDDGKEKNKYILAKSNRAHLYFAPGYNERVDDPKVPLAIQESEKATLALHCLSRRADWPVLPVGTGGCYSWRGTIGIGENSNGHRVPVKGPLPDLTRLLLPQREVFILVDSNVRTNPLVKAAYRQLRNVLAKFKVIIRSVNMPDEPGINGPDDFIATYGDRALMDLLCEAKQTTAEDAIAGFSEDELARAFSSQFDDELQYVAAWGQWFSWNGYVWLPDQTYKIFDEVRKVCRTQSQAVDLSASLARKISSASTTAAVVALARSDRRHAATTEQWDSNAWLLNTPGGIVNLRSGEQRNNCKGDFCTKITAVGPGGESSESPLWIAFLDRITDGNVDLQTFLQRVAGYCLTGWTREDVFFFFFGTGRNGKGTFLNTLTRIFNDYARTAPSEMFLISHGERHPADLAMLRGARLVVASETESGKRWAESRIKTLTGGDRICARFMRQDFFEYVPQFKLIVSGNHKPVLRNVDEAMRSRFYLVPFKVTIPAEERDKNLADKLRNEWPAILRWCIDGCLAWQHEGLNPPRAVIDASNEYMEDQDTFGRWISDCCVQGSQFEATSKALYASFREWAGENNEYAPSQKMVSQVLSERGFEIEHRRNGSVIKRLALKADSPEGKA